MGKYQKQVGDVVELTEEGISKIGQYKNNYMDSTRPIFAKERDWTAWSMGNLWIGMLVSIAVYQVASGLIVAGMAWYQALFVIVLGHTLVMGFAVILGHFGTKYGLTFPMLCKLVFGPKGILIPALIRGIIGIFWFGVQSWIGGQAINAIIGVIVPAWKNIGFTGLFISFLIFWVINVYIAGSGSKAVKALQSYSAPMLIILSFVVIVWGLSTADWSLSTLLAEPSLQGGTSSQFWILFFPALSAMIAFDGGIALSMADFTRHSKSQKSQVLGQIVGAPVMTAFIAFVGICGTAGAALAFGEAIWEPAILVSKFSNPFIVVFFSIFIIIAVLTTNVAANLVPPTNVLATLFGKKISYKMAAFLAASFALLAQPWKVLATPDALIFEVLGILGALLGPISGIFVVAYLFAHKTHIDLVDLYREDGGKYYYTKGWNIQLILILLLATTVVLIGKFIPSMNFIYDNSYVIGSIGAGLVYYIYLKVSKIDVKMAKEVGDVKEDVSY